MRAASFLPVTHPGPHHRLEAGQPAVEELEIQPVFIRNEPRELLGTGDRRLRRVAPPGRLRLDQFIADDFVDRFRQTEPGKRGSHPQPHDAKLDGLLKRGAAGPTDLLGEVDAPHGDVHEGRRVLDGHTRAEGERAERERSVQTMGHRVPSILAGPRR